METIYDYLKLQVALHPDAPAVSDAHSSLTFWKLDRLTSQIAAGFPGQPKRIGVVMWKSRCRLTPVGGKKVQPSAIAY